jgi:hypothetical protein
MGRCGLLGALESRAWGCIPFPSYGERSWCVPISVMEFAGARAALERMI